MLESIPFSIAVGIVLGFLTGLGTGGGSLLVLWLTLVLNVDSAEARTVNLMFFVPASLIATFFHFRQGKLPFRKTLLPATAGCVTAAVFALWAKKMNTESLQTLFGVLLILIGFKELLYRPRKPR